MPEPTNTPRRFRPAPDRFTDGVFVLLILLLVVEVVHLVWLDVV